ncbi:MAG TPA: hypothetical protein VFF67_02070 [Thermoplasmata archaeon]|nr:hypothetical protein [Thermoplasmata archaeon]
MLVNRPDIAARMALANQLPNSGPPVERVVVGNVGNARFTSISKAYNHAARRARGRYLVFLHQDAAFESPRWNVELDRWLAGRSFAIAAASGVVGHRLYYCDTEVLATNPELEVNEPRTADLVDEALFIVPRAEWLAAPFDEQLVDSFHLCAGEYSVRRRIAGAGVLLVPIRYAHRNLAAAGSDLQPMAAAKQRHGIAWVRAAERIRRAYPSETIVTSMGTLSTANLLLYRMYYGIAMRAFPRASLWAIERLLSGPAARLLNVGLKRLDYGPGPS